MRYRWSGLKFTIGYCYNMSWSDTSASQNIERMRTDGTERKTRLKYDLRTLSVDIKKKTKVKHSYFVFRNREMRREKRRDTFKRFRFNFTKYIFGYYDNTLLYHRFFPSFNILSFLSWIPIYSNEDFMLFKL